MKISRATLIVLLFFVALSSATSSTPATPTTTSGSLLTVNLNLCPILGVGLFRTVTQLDVNLNLRAYLNLNFPQCFPGGLIIGNVLGNHLLFADVNAVIGFLPQTGVSAALTATVLNPTSTSANTGGQLAGETLALKLTVALDLFDPKFCSSPVALSALVLIDGPLKGWTIQAVLDLANSLLSGVGVLPAGITLDAFVQVLVAINLNFQNGLVNQGLLAIPASTLLSLNLNACV